MSKVITEWRSALGLSADQEVDLDTSFWEVGGHSLAAMQLSARLGLPAGHLFNFEVVDTVNGLVEYLSNTTVKGNAAVAGVRQATDHGGGDLAVVGMSGRWPGFTGPVSLSALAERLSSNDYEPQPFTLEEKLVRNFDCDLFKTNPAEARLWDPHSRMLLEMAFECLLDAGIDPAAPGGTDCGVFVSTGSLQHYLELLLEEKGLR
jgi:hypothetical protein